MEKKSKEGRPRKPTFIDLFAGCGGISLGLMEAGWKGLFAIEKERMAFETLKHNLTGKKGNNYFNWPEWLEKKPHEISEFNTQHEKDLLRLRGKVDLVAGGPPCQGFSFAGKRSKQDPRNQLFKEYIKFLKIVQPRFCLIENVPGINIGLGKEKVLSNGNSISRLPIPYSEHIQRHLKKIGFSVIFNEILKAADCGVPQYRPRYLIIGVREELASHIPKKIILDLIQQSQNKTLKSVGLKSGSMVTVKDAISDLRKSGKKLEAYENWPKFKRIIYEAPRTQYQKFLHANRNGVPMNGHPVNSLRLPNHKEKTVARFKKIKSLCSPGVAIRKQILESLGTKKYGLVLLDANKPSHTLTTLPDDILHYAEPRILTVREYARLQSFPDWYEFKGNYTTGGKRRVLECPRYTQVVNAVPPLMAKVLGLVLKALLRKTRES